MPPPCGCRACLRCRGRRLAALRAAAAACRGVHAKGWRGRAACERLPRPAAAARQGSSPEAQIVYFAAKEEECEGKRKPAMAEAFLAARLPPSLPPPPLPLPFPLVGPPARPRAMPPPHALPAASGGTLRPLRRCRCACWDGAPLAGRLRACSAGLSRQPPPISARSQRPRQRPGQCPRTRLSVSARGARRWRTASARPSPSPGRRTRRRRPSSARARPGPPAAALLRAAPAILRPAGAPAPPWRM